jgi:hypothetical protein
MYFDGARLSYRNGVGVIFKSPDTIIHPRAIRMEFSCTNNEDEYEEMIQGMILALEKKMIILL